jgi:Tol biopolymer transport system component
VYRPSTNNNIQLAWYSRDGRRLASVGDPGDYHEIVLSPDEASVALDWRNPKTHLLDVWILEIKGGILSRVTYGPEAAASAVWSPDGRELVFASLRAGFVDLYRKVRGGSAEELLLASHELKWPHQWLNRGKSVIFKDGHNFYQLPLAGEPKPITLLRSEFATDLPRVSPDERWIAYQSYESGQWEVYVAKFPGFGERKQVSAGGGCQPLWRKDGKELFFLTLNGKLMAVHVDGNAFLRTEVPYMLFQTPVRVGSTEIEYCVTGDGKRFLFREPVGESTTPITVVLNWTVGLKQ